MMGLVGVVVRLRGDRGAACGAAQKLFKRIYYDWNACAYNEFSRHMLFVNMLRTVRRV